MGAAATSAAAPRSGLIRLLSAIETAIAYGLQAVLAIVGTALLASITLSVASRYVITVGGLVWAEELPKQLFIWFIMPGVVLAVQRGSHIAVDLLVVALEGRLKQMCIVGINLLIAAAYACMATVALEVAGITAAEQNPVLGISGDVPFFGLLAGSALIVVSSLIIALRVLLCGAGAVVDNRMEDTVQ
ncbi:putative TRAP dicarboxylate transporter, DctP-like subunit [uncultured Pleomorphomonas sp.]|uniref:TRAP transporter small permease protein n=1 Tax=uncultured Pleomorphomonas sp. TaxID=442121 RepID=A0A212LG53_9HYPH|nr:TRAP transporter small permease subunit [uncultured Pleomorphomonas sp.]SCM76546.1 putative TRAP dicarboxylate transporter, DctP-like subunit [uncultured Pleomorphomonas sp.]